MSNVNTRINEIVEQKDIKEYGVSSTVDRLLKTKLAIVVFLVMLLAAQVHHTVQVFSYGQEITWYAWSYSIGIEGAILIFVVNSWRFQSVLLSIATIVTNLLYGKYIAVGMPVEISVTISTMLGLSIAGFSHLYYVKMQQVNEAVEKAELEERQRKIEEKEEAVSAAQQLKELTPKKPVATCPRPNCGKSFFEGGKINGHITAHKKKDPKSFWKGMEYVGTPDGEPEKEELNISLGVVSTEEKENFKPSNPNLIVPLPLAPNSSKEIKGNKKEPIEE